MPTVLVTGSAGLIGSEAVHFFAKLGFVIIGIDNDFRAHFFGESASTRWNRDLLKDQYGDRYKHYSSDIALIIHTAAQPSHDWAAKDIKIPPRTSLKSVRCRRSLGVIH
jgi:CDP-paratose 2-epimerase